MHVTHLTMHFSNMHPTKVQQCKTEIRMPEDVLLYSYSFSSIKQAGITLLTEY